MQTNNNEILRLRKKLIDAEDALCKLEDINNLFTPFANENSPEGSIIAALITVQIENLQNIIKF